MTQTKTVTQAMTELRQSVEGFNAAQTERIGSPSLGDVVRQGDIYLVCISKLPDGEKFEGNQLVAGNTQGSRHCAEGNVKIVSIKNFEYNGRTINSVLLGPAFECVGDVEVTHPEHGNKILPQGTCWQVVHQQAYADEIRRVQD